MIKREYFYNAECDECGQQFPYFDSKEFLIESLKMNGWIKYGREWICRECNKIYMVKKEDKK